MTNETLNKLRTCLRDPIPEIFDAARLLDAAVSAYKRDAAVLAAQLIQLADISEIGEWTNSLWGKGGPWAKPPTPDSLTPSIPREQRVPVRMPTSAEQRQLIERDGLHCRFCGIPLIRRQVQSRMIKAFPNALRWGPSDREKHHAFQAMWVQFDHVVPHARGGTNDLTNIVVTCAPCNYGRGHLTLEEVGILNPQSRPPFRSTWDGLERF